MKVPEGGAPRLKHPCQLEGGDFQGGKLAQRALLAAAQLAGRAWGYLRAESGLI